MIQKQSKKVIKRQLIANQCIAEDWNKKASLNVKNNLNTRGNQAPYELKTENLML